MALALDTNCLLRWLIRDVPEQAAVIDKLLEHERVHIADMTIAEMVWVMKTYYHLQDTTIAASIAQIVAHDKINCNRALFGQVLDEMNKPPRVSFIDLCLAHYARLSGAKLLTFDKTLAKRLPKLVKLAV